jgi:hypothetical protein
MKGPHGTLTRALVPDTITDLWVYPDPTSAHINRNETSHNLDHSQSLIKSMVDDGRSYLDGMRFADRQVIASTWSGESRH